MMSGFDILSRQDHLRNFRVRIRNEIARQEQLLRWKSGDAVDGQRRLEGLRMQLRSTEREWAEIQAMLGRPHPVKPVKLNVPAVRTQPARAQPVRLRQPGPYLTRMMGSW
jgi:hypothetical protein